MHAQTAHGAPGTENDVVTLPEEETKIQKLRDRLNEVYNPIISRPDEDGEEGGNEDEDGTGDEGKDDTQQTDKNNHISKDSTYDASNDVNSENSKNEHDETNHDNNTDIDMETADEEDDADEEDSEDIDTNESDMNDGMEDNKEDITLQPHTNSIHEMNHQHDTTRSVHSSISPQYQSAQSQPQQVSTSSNHVPNTAHHSSPMLGSHEMVATSNSSTANNISSQNPMPNTQQMNAHLSHQPHLQVPHHPPHEMQHGNTHHLLPSGQQQPQPQHHNIQHPEGLSTHHNQQQQHISNTNSIPNQMQSHSNATPANNHILGVNNVMRPTKEEDQNPLSSSMLDEFEQQMNQYQQQH